MDSPQSWTNNKEAAQCLLQKFDLSALPAIDLQRKCTSPFTQSHRHLLSPRAGRNLPGAGKKSLHTPMHSLSPDSPISHDHHTVTYSSSSHVTAESSHTNTGRSLSNVSRCAYPDIGNIHSHPASATGSISAPGKHTGVRGLFQTRDNGESSSSSSENLLSSDSSDSDDKALFRPRLAPVRNAKVIEPSPHGSFCSSCSPPLNMSSQASPVSEYDYQRLFSPGVAGLLHSKHSLLHPGSGSSSSSPWDSRSSQSSDSEYEYQQLFGPHLAAVAVGKCREAAAKHSGLQQMPGSIAATCQPDILEKKGQGPTLATCGSAAVAPSGTPTKVQQRIKQQSLPGEVPSQQLDPRAEDASHHTPKVFHTSLAAACADLPDGPVLELPFKSRLPDRQPRLMGTGRKLLQRQQALCMTTSAGGTGLTICGRSVAWSQQQVKQSQQQEKRYVRRSLADAMKGVAASCQMQQQYRGGQQQPEQQQFGTNHRHLPCEKVASVPGSIPLQAYQHSYLFHLDAAASLASAQMDLWAKEASTDERQGAAASSAAVPRMQPVPAGGGGATMKAVASTGVWSCWQENEVSQRSSSSPGSSTSSCQGDSSGMAVGTAARRIRQVMAAAMTKTATTQMC